MSGINFGQNIGQLVKISGTVGAARAAAARSVSALAAGQGLGDPVDFPAGVKQVVARRSSQRSSLINGSAVTAVLLQNLDITSWATGSLRGLVDVPISTGPADAELGKSDCNSTATDKTDDHDVVIDQQGGLDQEFGVAPFGQAGPRGTAQCVGFAQLVERGGVGPDS